MVYQTEIVQKFYTLALLYTCSTTEPCHPYIRVSTGCCPFKYNAYLITRDALYFRTATLNFRGKALNYICTVVLFFGRIDQAGTDTNFL